MREVVRVPAGETPAMEAGHQEIRPSPLPPFPAVPRLLRATLLNKSRWGGEQAAGIACRCLSPGWSGLQVRSGSPLALRVRCGHVPA